MNELPSICVCICTYKRPSRLNALLAELIKQESQGLFSISIVIVDNDSFCSARPVVAAHSRQSDIAIRYYVEPCQNIALARNKAVEEATGDFFAFIDDDELPGPNWLLSLFRAIQYYKADGVLGPVLPRFDKKPPKWVTNGRFFDRPSHYSGRALEWQYTRTGNVLFRAFIFRENDATFNPVFGSGGEDRDFFKRMIRTGKIFVWCKEAPVYESIPAERWEIGLMIKRALLRGKMSFLSSSANLRSIFLSLMAIAFYTLGLPFLYIFRPLFGYALFVTYLVKDFDHLGKILALVKIDPIREKYISST
jgi:succinoglycan biosynthesis protein ExoM